MLTCVKGQEMMNLKSDSAVEVGRIFVLGNSLLNWEEKVSFLCGANLTWTGQLV